jgi:hypothetical protein
MTIGAIGWRHEKPPASKGVASAEAKFQRLDQPIQPNAGAIAK